MPLITVHKALFKGKCWQIAGSHDMLLRALLENAIYEESDAEAWTFETERIDVPLVEAEFFVCHGDDGKDYHHAKWYCPECNQAETTDIASYEVPPVIWFNHCEDNCKYLQVTWSIPSSI